MDKQLSPREWETLELMAAGLGNAGIAQRLVVEPATICTYIEHIYTKLGLRFVRDGMRYARVEAVLWFQAQQVAG